MYKYAYAYIKTAVSIIAKYEGKMPFNNYLKLYFKEHKKYGGNDRKAINDACYSYFRFAKAVPFLSIEKQIEISIFVCSPFVQKWQILFQDIWKEQIDLTIEGKIEFLKQQNIDINIDLIFEAANCVSAKIDNNLFVKNHLKQPYTFIRIRPNYEAKVLAELQSLNIDFYAITPQTIVVKGSPNLDNASLLNKGFVVQDYSSQQLQKLLLQIKFNSNKALNFWDCCAASGGKSILAKDVLKNIKIHVSDVRPSILQNLVKRLSNANIDIKTLWVANLATPLNNHLFAYDIIWADVPCTGSGTWGRNPENLHFFNAKTIETFVALQKNIVKNSIEFLNCGGYFIYSTCSVFEKENEAIVLFIKETFDVQLIEAQYFLGYNNNADSMYGAIFVKN